ncbi:MAG: substrate-binding domain-containing protein [Hyphomicrobiales bacterium]|nr:substrate-binding domain-containing protein [Hyphomicrobiales bacterium]
MRVLTVALMLLAGAFTASAAELRIVSGGAPKDALAHIGPAFERTSGHRLTLTYAIVGEVQQRLLAGEPADVVLVPAPVMNAIEQGGKLRAGSRLPLARVGLAAVVRAGAAKPDVATPEALQRALRAARSITHSDPQTPGGRHIAAMLAKLGIDATPERKIIPRSAIGGGAQFIANGEIEIGLYLVSEVLSTKGVSVAGMLPAELQSYIVYNGAILADSKLVEPAGAFLRFLAEPAQQPHWQASGFEALSKQN